jgi:hypothetical protein
MTEKGDPLKEDIDIVKHFVDKLRYVEGFRRIYQVIKQELPHLTKVELDELRDTVWGVLDAITTIERCFPKGKIVSKKFALDRLGYRRDYEPFHIAFQIITEERKDCKEYSFYKERGFYVPTEPMLDMAGLLKEICDKHLSEMTNKKPEDSNPT